MNSYLKIPFMDFMIGIECDPLFRRMRVCLKSSGESLSILRKNVDKHPENADHKISLACALYQKGNLDEAKMLCYEALHIMPPDDKLLDDTVAIQSNALVHLLLGSIWLDMGKKEVALLEWQQASRLDRFVVGDRARQLLAEHSETTDNLPQYAIILMDENGDIQQPFSIRSFNEASRTFIRLTRRIKQQGFYGVGFIEYGWNRSIEQVAIETSKNKSKSTEFRKKFFEMIKSTR